MIASVLMLRLRCKELEYQIEERKLDFATVNAFVEQFRSRLLAGHSPTRTVAIPEADSAIDNARTKALKRWPSVDPRDINVLFDDLKELVDTHKITWMELGALIEPHLAPPP